MADTAMSSLPTIPSVSLTLIVAVIRSTNGIGLSGSLPWPQLKSEMAYFARVTRRVPSTLTQAHPTRKFQNAVIMGRKTWESIPPKFRPLKGRTNVVITRQKTLDGVDEHVLIASGIQDGIDKLKSKFWTDGEDATQEKVGLGRCFVIGGAEIYSAAMDMNNTTAVLCTSVLEPEFNCDTFFPTNLGEDKDWKRLNTKELEEFAGEENLGVEKTQDNVKWKYELWEKVS